jgi:serine/threonine protein kinase
MCRVTRELPAPIKYTPLQVVTPPASPLEQSTSRIVNVKTTENRLESKHAVVSRNSNVYEIGPTLREGKFGSICVGSTLKSTATENEFQRSAEKPVALKIYSTDKLKGLQGNAIENPWLEIEILQSIGNKHPNLVGVIETCIVDNHLYIVLPLFNGDLLDLMENRYGGSLPALQAKKMFQQIVTGLKSLHENGVAHRDLSIENILYDECTDTYAICDFGMALRVPRDPSTGAFLPLTNAPTCGKEGSIAPELWRREPRVDLFAADMWSMGVILFMALTGSAPMQRATEWDPYYQMISNNRLMEMLGVNDMCLEQETYGGLEVVQTILNPIPHMRPSASDLLSHSWLQ